MFTASLKKNDPVWNGLVCLADVRDVARAHVAAAEDPTASGRYLCMYGSTIGWREIAEMVQEAFPGMTGIQGLDAESVVKEKVDNSKVLNLLGGSLIDVKTSVADIVR